MDASLAPPEDGPLPSRGAEGQAVLVKTAAIDPKEEDPFPPSAAPPAADPLKEGGADREKETLVQRLLGSLAMMLVDRSCRQPYILHEPDFSTLFTLCNGRGGHGMAAVGDSGKEGRLAAGLDASKEEITGTACADDGLESWKAAAEAERDLSKIQERAESLLRERVAAARVLTSMAQRDHDARMSLVRTGRLKDILALASPTPVDLSAGFMVMHYTSFYL